MKLIVYGNSFSSDAINFTLMYEINFYVFFSFPIELTEYPIEYFVVFRLKLFWGVCGFNRHSLNSVPSITPFAFIVQEMMRSFQKAFMKSLKNPEIDFCVSFKKILKEIWEAHIFGKVNIKKKTCLPSSEKLPHCAIIISDKWIRYGPIEQEN